MALHAGLAEARMVMMLGGAEARPTTLHRALLQALEAMADGSAPQRTHARTTQAHYAVAPPRTHARPPHTHAPHTHARARRMRTKASRSNHTAPHATRTGRAHSATLRGRAPEQCAHDGAIEPSVHIAQLIGH
eukprot:5944395-Prymnesium_polylepis.1